ncbi:DUF7210 family protein [Paenibacillus tianjinensis]|uniref:DUF7210 domain-containing protein n=1 Tax=Paenibacillus tianjinensis TaxID=2810347 RepID=A0ABX7L6S4_9BACL|nr:hypothetical protein [Paenibacillus tianjinensis]QSF42664.1 hypothetical protein JRJ22_15205 [Paenibacillus tianjinensis]
MDIKLKGVVKNGGKWKKPGDIIRKVDDEIAEDLIAQGYAEEIEALPDDDAAELQELRERAKLLGVSNAGRLGKEKLLEGISEKHSDLQMKAAELGIEGTEDKSVEDLISAIAEAEKK